jgi:hypothetical protein
MFLNVLFNVIKKLNSASDKYSYWLGWLIVFLMIEEHIILVESSFNSINATCSFNTKAHFSKGEILMNWNVQNEWYNGKENTI